MALVTLNLKPTEKQLLDFGTISVFMLSIIGLLLWLLAKISIGGLAVFCAAGLAVFMLSRISTGLIRPVYQGLMIVTFPIGWVVSHIAMAIFFYGLITLVGLVYKLIGRDPLCRSYDRQVATYWQPYRQKNSIKDYFRQF